MRNILVRESLKTGVLSALVNDHSFKKLLRIN